MVVVFLHASLRAENIQRRGAVGAAVDADAAVFGAVCLNDKRAFLPRRKGITARDCEKKSSSKRRASFLAAGDGGSVYESGITFLWQNNVLFENVPVSGGRLGFGNDTEATIEWRRQL